MMYIVKHVLSRGRFYLSLCHGHSFHHLIVPGECQMRQLHKEYCDEFQHRVHLQMQAVKLRAEAVVGPY